MSAESNKNKSATRTVAVARDAAGEGLVPYLASRFSYQSEAEWRDHVESGRIELNGARCGPDATLNAGDSIAFTPEPYEEPPVNAAYAVLEERDGFLFIDKPAPLPCHPGGIYLHNTLWSLLRDRYGDVSLVNRLDRETSGIVIAALTREAAAYGSAIIAGRAMVKEYEALVEGRFPASIEAKGYLIPDKGSPIRKKARFVGEGGDDADADGAEGNGQRCHTGFTRVRLVGSDLSLVRARLHTGRTHQIRATFEALGYPIVGDKLYGRDPTIFLRFIEDALTDADRESLRLDRQALHCARVSFPALGGGRPYDVSCPFSLPSFETAARIPPG